MVLALDFFIPDCVDYYPRRCFSRVREDKRFCQDEYNQVQCYKSCGLCEPGKQAYLFLSLYNFVKSCQRDIINQGTIPVTVTQYSKL